MRGRWGFNNIYNGKIIARHCKMWRNGWPKDQIPHEVGRCDKWCHNGKKHNTTKRIESKHKHKDITISTMMMTKSSQVSTYKSTTNLHGSSKYIMGHNFRKVWSLNWEIKGANSKHFLGFKQHHNWNCEFCWELWCKNIGLQIFALGDEIRWYQPTLP